MGKRILNTKGSFDIICKECGHNKCEMKSDIKETKTSIIHVLFFDCTNCGAGFATGYTMQ